MGGLGGMLGEVSAGYGWLKWIHVLGVVIYIGGLMALTRLLGHAVRFQAAQSRADAYRVFQRMHKFANWIGLGRGSVESRGEAACGLPGRGRRGAGGHRARPGRDLRPAPPPGGPRGAKIPSRRERLALQFFGGPRLRLL